MIRVHWYGLPVWIAGAMAMGLIVADALVARPPDQVQGMSGYLRSSQVALAMGAVWFGWVAPLAEPLRVRVGDSPRHRLTLRRWQVWLPSGLIGLWMMIGLGIAVVELAEGRVAADTLVTPVLLVGVLVASVPVSAAVGRRFAERYRAFIRHEKHCFECGYNLRGNADLTQCPECGRPSLLAHDP